MTARLRSARQPGPAPLLEIEAHAWNVPSTFPAASSRTKATAALRLTVKLFNTNEEFCAPDPELGRTTTTSPILIHVAAGISGFVAALVVGPRVLKDQRDFKPNNMLLAVAGAGILWLGWNGFNGGDPYFANGDAAAAVLNTNLATAVALLSWFFLDMMLNRKLSVVGAINGMICGLGAITPAAGYVDGTGAILIGLLGASIPWFTMNRLSERWTFRKADDTLGVVHTHFLAGAVGAS